MPKDYNFLDNENSLILLNLEEKLHQIIHYPQQILAARKEAEKLSPLIKEGSHIIFKPDARFDLLFSWLQAAGITLEFNNFREGSLLLDLVYDSQNSKQGIILKDIAAREDKAVFLDLSPINSADANSVFLGAICKIWQLTGKRDLNAKINSLVALLMQKAGALTWRNPTDRNFAKIWAVRFCEEGLLAVSSFSGSEYDLIAKVWEKMLSEKGIKQHGLKISLGSFGADRAEDGTIAIYGDGKNLLEGLVTLYHLGVIVSIYCELILKNKYIEV